MVKQTKVVHVFCNFSFYNFSIESVKVFVLFAELIYAPEYNLLRQKF